MSEQAYDGEVIACAHAFRTIMNAVSRPGRVLPFDATHQAPLPLWPTAASVARTLCDFQTPVWLAPEICDDAVRQYIRFHTGAPGANKPEEAVFIFLQSGADIAMPSVFAQGTQEYPDRSATLVIQTASLSNSGSVELSGPGLPLPVNFHADGMPLEFWEAMVLNHEGFPLGVDVIFVSPDAIAALPRSTAIRLQETI